MSVFHEHGRPTPDGGPMQGWRERRWKLGVLRSGVHFSNTVFGYRLTGSDTRLSHV